VVVSGGAIDIAGFMGSGAGRYGRMLHVGSRCGCVGEGVAVVVHVSRMGVWVWVSARWVAMWVCGCG
jgi:hypothetical protein